MSHELTFQELNDFSIDFNRNPKNQVITRAAKVSGVLAASYNQNVEQKLNRVFSTELDTQNVTNQKHSGRCWEFATLNVLRHAFGKKYHTKNFTFSQAYNFFWDKIERANIFYDNILASADQPLDSRLVSTYLSYTGYDGGQFGMATALIEKYGIVPSYAMPESFNANDTTGFAAALGNKLKKDALALRTLKQANKTAEIEKTRKQFLSEVYQMTAIAVGEPPKNFDLEYYDDQKNYHLDKNLTPLEFLHKYLNDVDFDDYVVLANFPDHEYNKLYSISKANNVAGVGDLKLLNVPIDVLENATIKQLKDGEAVWFGNDVTQQAQRKNGYLDTNLYQLSDLFGVNLDMSKADKLRTGAASFTHAMAFVGVDEDHGDIRQWKVENSWGNANGDQGYFVMSDSWFKDYVYETAVHKKYLTKQQIALAEGEAIDVPAWDSLV